MFEQTNNKHRLIHNLHTEKLWVFEKMVKCFQADERI